MKRRAFLKIAQTAAGAALLSPFLSQVARAQTTPTPRFVFFVEGNGFEPVTVLSPSARAAIDATMTAPIGAQRYWSRTYRHTTVLQTSGDLAQASSLQDLGALAAKTVVLLGLSSKITGGGHSAYHGVLSSRRSAAGQPTGETIDAHLSRLANLSGTAFPAYRLGYISQQYFPGRTLDYGTCALGPDLSAPLVLDPRQAYDSLFGPLVNRAEFDRKGRILDFAHTDVQRALGAFSGSSQERAKLEAYLAAIDQSFVRRQLLESGVSGVTAPARPAARSADDFFPVVQAQASNIAIALQAGLTRVAVLGIATGFNFDTFYDSTHTSRHATEHLSETTASARDYIHAQGRKELAVMISLAARLDAIPEGSGTLLDHTVLVYIGDNGETHHATADEFPVVVMGGGAIGLRTGGRSLVYPGQDQFGQGHRQVSNLWNTLGHLAKEDLNAFGGEKLITGTRSAEGPLSELLV